MAKTIVDLPENGHERRQAQRRAEILAAATSLFFEKGYGRTSIDDIINTIGGSKRTLYHYFKGKEELFAAIVANVSGRVLTGLEWDESEDFRAILQAMGIRYLEVLLMPETLALYRAIVSEASFFPELAESFFQNGPVRVVHSLVQFFEAHNRQGKVLVHDPETTAKQFIGMLRGDNHLAAVLMGKKFFPRQIREHVEKTINTLMGGAIEVSPTRGKLKAK